MIDLSLMSGVRVDPELRRAWVEGGATWGDVDAATQAFGLATPGGLISDTGVGGLTLNGGIGWLRSRYGLSIDNLVAADVVTADGRMVHASADEDPDLLWALRGGGGNFGVVTGFEFALHPVGPTVMFCAPIYPIEAGAGPIRAWRDFLADKHDRVGSMVEFSTIPESADYPEAAWGRRVYTIAAVYAGDAAEGEALLQPLRELGEPVADFSGQMPYVDVQRLFDAVIPFGRHRCYWKSQYLDGLGDDVIDLVVEGNRQPPSAEHAVLDLELRRRHRGGPGRRDRIRRSLDALDGLVRLDLGHRRPGRGQHRLDPGPLGAAPAVRASRPHLPQLPRSRRGRRGPHAPLVRRELREAGIDQAALRPDQHVPLQPEHHAGALRRG